MNYVGPSEESLDESLCAILGARRDAGEVVIHPFWNPEAPYLHTVRRGDGYELHGALPPGGSSFVVRLDGAEISTLDDAYTQLWERMRLPGYFGWSLDALSDCLTDLRWIQADGYLIYCERADQLLSDYPAERTQLLDVLANAAEYWGVRVDPVSRLGKPFNVVLEIVARDDNGIAAEVHRVNSQRGE